MSRLKNILKKATSLAMAAIMIMCIMSPVTCMAEDDITKITLVNEMLSDTYNDEYVALKASGSTLKVTYHSKIYAYQYRLGVTPVAGEFKYICYVTPDYDEEEMTNGFTHTIDLSAFSAGYYYFNIARARTEWQAENKSNYGDGGNCYRNALLNISSKGTVKLCSFENMINYNNSITKNPALSTPQAFTDVNMTDVFFLLNDDTGTYRAPSSSEKAYIKSIAQRETEGCSSAYDKAAAIYAYVSANTYYDVLSNKSLKDAKTNPYDKIKSIENGEKTTTVCTGYSAMSIAMLRSLGVPARLVFGHHLTTPTESWKTLKINDIKTVDDHYWVEFYDGTKWIMFDATTGTSNKWKRSNKNDVGEYIGGNRIDENTTSAVLNNYTYFDPTDEQLAVTHCVHGIYSKTLISNANDISRLNTFLNQKNKSGVANRNQLDFTVKYNSKDKNIISGNAEMLYTNARTGDIEKIIFSGTASADGKMYGAANFSNMKGLKWLGLSYNKGITSLDVTGDSAAQGVSAASCGVTSVKATGCTSLESLNVGYNPIKTATYTFKSNKTATVTAQTGGTFHLKYENGKHSMTAKANNGYYFLGWYNSAGTKLSTSLTYTTSTSSSFTITAKFKKLAAPANVKVSIDTASSQKISWDKVSGASGYYIFKSTSKNGTYVRSAVSGENTTSIVKTGLTGGKTYYYYVVAYKNVSGSSVAVQSSPSEIVSKKVVPPKPSVSLTAGKKKVTVKCPKLANVNGYEICRSTSKNGTYKVIKTFNYNVTTAQLTYEDKGLKSGKTYYYKMRAYRNENGKKIYSSYSTVKSAKVK